MMNTAATGLSQEPCHIFHGLSRFGPEDGGKEGPLLDLLPDGSAPVPVPHHPVAAVFRRASAALIACSYSAFVGGSVATMFG
jgi:hypothetical protein